MEGTEQVQPSTQYYLVAPAFFVGGAILALFLTALGIHQIRNAMLHAEVPGELEMELKQNETYVILLQGETRPEAAAAAAKTLSCEVHVLPAGGSFSAQPVAPSNSWFVSYVGIPLFEFTPPHKGEYSVECTDSQEGAPQLHVGIAGGVVKALSALFSRCIVILILGLVAALLAVWRVTMLRLESRKDIRERGLVPVS